MTDLTATTFTDPAGNQVSEQEMRLQASHQVPWAVRELCLMSNTPIPGFARLPTDPLPDNPDQLVLDIGLTA